MNTTYITLNENETRNFRFTFPTSGIYTVKYSLNDIILLEEDIVVEEVVSNIDELDQAIKDTSISSILLSEKLHISTFYF